MRDQIKTELSQARSGRPVGIERVELGLSPRGALELRAIGVTVEDGRGGVLSRSEEARISLDVLPLLIARISVSRAEFSGGAITFTRRPNGALDIAFGPEGAPPDIIIPPPPLNETLEQRVARVLDSMEGAFKPVGAGGSLRELSACGAQLTLIDEASGGRWTADAANLQLARRGRSLALSANAELEGAEGRAPASLRITTDTRFQSAVIEFGALFERQFRYPLRRVFLELPAGKIDPGESILDTGRRELLEETGHVASDWEYVGVIHPCIGYSDERIEIFAARGLRRATETQLDHNEFLEVLELTPAEARAAVWNGQITDAKTITALFWLDKP